ncbi:MAG: hypothetical protein H5U36_07400 [Candidatus Caldatribacterium sp.]|nr:hypothetical protein [Candidatus Caldatribacterium sp.]
MVLSAFFLYTFPFFLPFILGGFAFLFFFILGVFVLGWALLFVFPIALFGFIAWMLFWIFF